MLATQTTEYYSFLAVVHREEKQGSNLCAAIPTRYYNPPFLQQPLTEPAPAFNAGEPTSHAATNEHHQRRQQQRQQQVGGEGELHDPSIQQIRSVPTSPGPVGDLWQPHHYIGVDRTNGPKFRQKQPSHEGSGGFLARLR